MKTKNFLVFFSIFAAFGVGALGIYLIFGNKETADKASGGNLTSTEKNRIPNAPIEDSFANIPRETTSLTENGERETNYAPNYPLGSSYTDSTDSEKFNTPEDLFTNWYPQSSYSQTKALVESAPPVTTRATTSLTKNGERETNYPPNYPLGSSYTVSENFNMPVDEGNQTLSINTSPYRDKIKIKTVNYSYDKNPKNEYVEIVAAKENTGKILISGFELRSGITGRGAFIGKGVYLPFFGVINKEEPVFLAPGERAYIITGHSPVGYGMKINKCSGYFARFRDFNPRINLECPLLISEKLPEPPNALSDACIDYLKSFGRCQVRVGEPAKKVEPECVLFVDRHVGYEYCVNTYKTDSDFYKNEWRLYLGRDETLWKSKNELIKLLDQEGRVIDIKFY
jgi:hypothetical protein